VITRLEAVHVAIAQASGLEEAEELPKLNETIVTGSGIEA
jgi:hypothetical protein